MQRLRTHRPAHNDTRFALWREAMGPGYHSAALGKGVERFLTETPRGAARPRR